jgi:hypothetical protein
LIPAIEQLAHDFHPEVFDGQEPEHGKVKIENGVQFAAARISTMSDSSRRIVGVGLRRASTSADSVSMLRQFAIAPRAPEAHACAR